MIIVTADTNIDVSALHFGGLPLVLLDHARAGAFRLAASIPLLAEIYEILQRKFAWPEVEITAALSQLDACTIHVHPTETLHVVQDDPDDDRILECAVAAQAGFIVSGDRHLLRLGRYRGIHILKAADFMSLLPTL